MRRVIALVGILYAASLIPVSAQMAPWLRRYTTAAESGYLLERCGELTEPRRAWLQHARENEIRQSGWSAAQLVAYDAAVKRDFDKIYPTVAKERCAEVSKGIDIEVKASPTAK